MFLPWSIDQGAKKLSPGISGIGLSSNTRADILATWLMDHVLLARVYGDYLFQYYASPTFNCPHSTITC